MAKNDKNENWREAPAFSAYLYFVPSSTGLPARPLRVLCIQGIQGERRATKTTAPFPRAATGSRTLCRVNLESLGSSLRLALTSCTSQTRLVVNGISLISKKRRSPRTRQQFPPTGLRPTPQPAIVSRSTALQLRSVLLLL